MAFRLRGDNAKFRAAEVNRWNRLADQQLRGELRSTPRATLKNFDPSARVALCKNTSGSDRAAFETMAIDDLLWPLETDGTADVIFELITADPDKAPAILLDPIADGEFGRAVLDGLAIALVGGGTGTFAAPEAANHRLAPSDSGTIRLLSPPHPTDPKLVPVVIGSTPPATQHYLYTLTGTISAGSGTATIRNLADDTEIETGATVNDPLGHFDGLTAGDRGFCLKDGDEYYALGPYVVALNWSSPDLRQTKDGTTFTTINTADPC